MSRVGFFRRAMMVAMLTVAVAVVGSQSVWARHRGEGPAAVLHLFGVAIGLGLVVIGAGLGIGRLAAAAADGIARQPAPPTRSPAR